MKSAFVGKQIVANLNKLYSNPLKGEGKYIFFEGSSTVIVLLKFEIIRDKEKTSIIFVLLKMSLLRPTFNQQAFRPFVVVMEIVVI